MKHGPRLIQSDYGAILLAALGVALVLALFVLSCTKASAEGYVSVGMAYDLQTQKRWADEYGRVNPLSDLSVGYNFKHDQWDGGRSYVSLYYRHHSSVMLLDDPMTNDMIGMSVNVLFGKGGCR